MSDEEDVPLFSVDTSSEAPEATTHDTGADSDMATLRIGSTIRVPELPGQWSVWSQAAEGPGAYFVIPVDPASRALDVKYAVVRARMPRGAAEPILTALRTDPSREIASA